MWKYVELRDTHCAGLCSMFTNSPPELASGKFGECRRAQACRTQLGPPWLGIYGCSEAEGPCKKSLKVRLVIASPDRHSTTQQQKQKQAAGFFFVFLSVKSSDFAGRGLVSTHTNRRNVLELFPVALANSHMHSGDDRDQSARPAQQRLRLLFALQ